MREIVFDTETTGTDYDKDKIISIGAVELIDRKITNNIFYKVVNPHRKITSEITRITHFTDDDLIDKPDFEDIANDFLSFIKEDILIAHNAPFDIKFLNNELKNIGYSPISNKIIDTLKIAEKKRDRKIKGNSLDDLCEEYKIDISERKTKGHGALLDSQLLAKVYLKLIENQLTLSFNKKDTQEDFDKYIEDIKNRKKLEPRNFDLTSEEINNHKNFINKLKEKYPKSTFLWYQDENNS